MYIYIRRCFVSFIFQVNHNLFSASPVGLHVSPGGSSLTHATEQTTQPPNIMHYSCERQLQYCTVLSKPSTTAAAAGSTTTGSSGTAGGEAATKGKGSKKEKAAAKGLQAPPTAAAPDVVMKCTVPKFYNVRPIAVMDESQPQPEIDEEVYMEYVIIVLTC